VSCPAKGKFGILRRLILDCARILSMASEDCQDKFSVRLRVFDFCRPSQSSSCEGVPTTLMKRADLHQEGHLSSSQIRLYIGSPRANRSVTRSLQSVTLGPSHQTLSSNANPEINKVTGRTTSRRTGLMKEPVGQPSVKLLQSPSSEPATVVFRSGSVGHT
jgi:hypothetical protein